MTQPTTFNIPVTPEQATALLQLIDLAVKSGGLQVASTAVFLHNLIQTAHKQSQEMPSTAPENPV